MWFVVWYRRSNVVCWHVSWRTISMYQGPRARNAEGHNKYSKWQSNLLIINKYNTNVGPANIYGMLTFLKWYICSDLSCVLWQIGLCTWIIQAICGLVLDAWILEFELVFMKCIVHAILCMIVIQLFEWKKIQSMILAFLWNTRRLSTIFISFIVQDCHYTFANSHDDQDAFPSYHEYPC